MRRGSLRLFLDRTGSGEDKRQVSGCWISVAHGLIPCRSLRQGDGGLRPRYAHWAEWSPMSYCCQTSTARARLERARLGGGVASGLVAGTYLTIGTIRRRMTWPRRLQLGHCTAFPIDSFKQWSAVLHFHKARFFPGRHSEGFGTSAPGDFGTGADSHPGGYCMEWPRTRNSP